MMSPTAKFISLAILLLTLFACKPAAGNDAAVPEPVLHTYMIPAGMGEQVVYLLNNSIPAGKGRAELLPNGHLALVALPSIQAGMDELLVMLKDAPTLQSVNAQMELWFILAPNNGELEGNLNDPELVKALSQVTHTKSLRLMEKMTLHAAEGSKAAARGNYFSLEYSLRKEQGSLRAALDVTGVGSKTRLDTELYIQPDKYLLLGETSMEIRDDESSKLGVPEGLYSLIVVLRTRTSGE